MCKLLILLSLLPSTAGQYKLSVDILLYLTKVPWFEMNAIFLGPIEKEGKRHINSQQLHCMSPSSTQGI